MPTNQSKAERLTLVESLGTDKLFVALLPAKRDCTGSAHIIFTVDEVNFVLVATQEQRERSPQTSQATGLLRRHK